jgi:hypothetical protein
MQRFNTLSVKRLIESPPAFSRRQFLQAGATVLALPWLENFACADLTHTSRLEREFALKRGLESFSKAWIGKHRATSSGVGAPTVRH